MRAILILALFSIILNESVLAQEKSLVEQTEVLGLEWSRILDFKHEIIGTDNTQLYEDWVLIGGDIDSLPTLFAFNKHTGKKIWQYFHQGELSTGIIHSRIFEDIYIGICNNGIICIDLTTRKLEWELNFNNHGIHKGNHLDYFDGRLYHEVSIGGRGAESLGVAIISIDLETGSYEEVAKYNNSIDGIKMLSPINIAQDLGSDKKFILFNEYPNSTKPPEQATQNLVALNFNTLDTVWIANNFTKNFPSNSCHPVLVDNNIVITGGDSSIYAFDLLSGKLLWKYTFDYPWAIWGKTNHLVKNGKLYVNNSQHDVTCLNLNTGEVIWNNPKGGSNCTDNMIYIESEDLLVFTSWGKGSVILLDANTGAIQDILGGYNGSTYNNDVVYDDQTGLLFTSTYKHVVGLVLEYR